MPLSKLVYRLCAALSIAMAFIIVGGCGPGLSYWVDIRSHSIAPNPVPAPTAAAPSNFVLTMTVEAYPYYEFADLLIGSTDNTQTAFASPLASIDLTCRSEQCDAGTVRINCSVSLGTDTAGVQRLIRCDGDANTYRVDAGRYAYRLSAMTRGGTIYSADRDSVEGSIEFR